MRSAVSSLVEEKRPPRAAAIALALLLAVPLACSRGGKVANADGGNPDAAAAGTGGGGAPGTGGRAATGGGSGASGEPAGTGGTTGGGGGSGGGTSGTTGCGDLIDDFEDRDGYICRGNGRQGYWYTAERGGPGSILPPPSISPTPGRVFPAPRATSLAGVEAYSPPGVLSDHPVLGVGLNVAGDAIGTFDASTYDGIQLWVEQGTDCYFHAEMGTPETMPTSRGGTCLAGCQLNQAPNYPTGSSWELLKIPFAALSGGNKPFDPSRIMNIDFVMNHSVFDCTFDDVSFYRNPGDAGGGIGVGGKGGSSGSGGGGAAGRGGTSGGDAGATGTAGRVGGVAGAGGTGAGAGGAVGLALKLEYATSNVSYTAFSARLTNVGSTAPSINTIKIRYYYLGSRSSRAEESLTFMRWRLNMPAGAFAMDAIPGATVDLTSSCALSLYGYDPPQSSTADVGCSSASFALQPTDTLDFNVLFNSLLQGPTDDYSYMNTNDVLTPNMRMTVWVDGNLVWGVPPPQ